ncbi:SH3 domain-containing protein [Allomuricauda sp. SCSIO 65647]|uniref:SH3 domain-containing protein n=1 Tax=Allomuricauda sp. SCSIO 65647 TaxID=2908843 RepID=UPI001F42EAB6|nr:tetratricopeptide repeat protein [Muricauda sp. SCSIO 65647]UJH66016.1 tetratricopeptide repeat protein [Muricauda sp. SCSIO 65647]
MKKYLASVVLFASVWANAQSDQLFSQANDAYNSGEYQKAIELYEEIIADGLHSSELYFNLGNAHYKLNEIGPSIYYYEKALLLNPSDGEIKNNLVYAQNMRLDAIEKMPKTAMAKIYEGVIGLFSFDQWAAMAVISAMIFVLAYLFYYFMRSALKKRIAFISSMVSMFLAFWALIFSYLRHQEYKNDKPAIIFSEEVKITAEPNNRSQAVFILHEGTKVNVLDQYDGWSKIKIADGQTGWMPTENLKSLKDF